MIITPDLQVGVDDEARAAALDAAPAPPARRRAAAAPLLPSAPLLLGREELGCGPLSSARCGGASGIAASSSVGLTVVCVRMDRGKSEGFGLAEAKAERSVSSRRDLCLPLPPFSLSLPLSLTGRRRRQQVAEVAAEEVDVGRRLEALAGELPGRRHQDGWWGKLGSWPAGARSAVRLVVSVLLLFSLCGAAQRWDK